MTTVTVTDRRARLEASDLTLGYTDTAVVRDLDRRVAGLHPHDHRVPATGDPQRDRRLPQVVGPERREAAGHGGGTEEPSAELVRPQEAALGRGEHEVVGPAPEWLDVVVERVDGRKAAGAVARLSEQHLSVPQPSAGPERDGIAWSGSPYGEQSKVVFGTIR